MKDSSASNTKSGMIVTVLWWLENQPKVTDASNFADVASDKYFAEVVAWAEENVIVKRYDSDTYAPIDNTTREQLAAILYRYVSYKGYDVTAVNDFSAFLDAMSVSDWALISMKWAVEEGLITRITSSTLSPESNATRAQVAAMMMRFIENI